MGSSIDVRDSWLNTASSNEVVKRSLKVSLLVGSILAMINHGDQLFSGGIGRGVLWKILLTYCVPYAVSTFASVDAIRSNDLQR